ncbi:MAG: IS21 family transposase [bacterium]
MLVNKEKTKAIAATKAGMDEKTARKYLRLDKLPSQCKKPHLWRTREDPLEKMWPEAESMLAINSGLQGKTIFDYMRRKCPGEYHDGYLRTLQRRIKVWRATEGPAKEVFFPQVHYPGQLSASDFTRMFKLGVRIGGELFKHLIYHFVLTYSNWETGTICFSESFESLSVGLQNALWQLGGVTEKHRTDRMSAAVNKDCNPEKFTKDYKGLLDHYGIEPERINAGKANENGDAEQSHHRFKQAVDQALMLRGSRDFETRVEYDNFLAGLFDQLNAGRQQRFQEELAVLRLLPKKRLNACKTIEKTVGPSSTINLLHNIYSVHSRLIKEKIRARVYVDHIELWYGQKQVELLPRLQGESKEHIQYRHIIDWLVRKPGAFENYRYKPAMFPSSRFRIAYDYLKQHDRPRANKEYLQILYLASKEGESATESAIQQLILADKVICAESVKEIVEKGNHLPLATEIVIADIDLKNYDELLSSDNQGGLNHE